MGLLEYQAMFPCVTQIMTVLSVQCTLYNTFNNRSVPDRDKWCGPAGQAAWTVHRVQNYTLLGHFPPASQAVRRVGSVL
jgi:hypothetical protein